MKALKILGVLLTIALFALPLFSCGGEGGPTGVPTPDPGSTDPADVVLGVRYQISGIYAGQSSTIFAKVFDYNGDKVADGTVVRFQVFADPELSGFQFPNSQATYDRTTVSGVASAVLTHVGSLAAPQTVQVLATTPGFIQVARSIDVFFFDSLAVSFDLTLTPDKVTLVGDGADYTRIRARILNLAGVTFVGAEITFETDPDFGSFEPVASAGSFEAAAQTTRITNELGEAEVLYVAGQTNKPTTVTIIATARLVFYVNDIPLGQVEVAYSVFDLISLGINAPEAGAISIEADPTRIHASVTGATVIDQSQLTIRGFDTNGHPMINGTVVQLESRNKEFPENRLGLLPAFVTLGDVVTSTGSVIPGAAIVNFFSEGEPGIAVITASIGAVQGTAEIEIFDENPLIIVDPETSQPLTDYTMRITECEPSTKIFGVTGGLADFGQGSYVWETAATGGTVVDVFFDPEESSIATLVYDGSTISGLDAGEIATYRINLVVTDTSSGKTRRFTAYVELEGVSQCDSDLMLVPTSDLFLVGTADQVDFTASGGSPPYSWSFNRGSVTFGDVTLTFAGDRAVLTYDGSPDTTPGVMIVTVTDAEGAMAHALVTMQLTTGLPLSLTVNPDEPFTVGTAAVRNLTASGGVQPYAWTFDPGTVTPGDMTFLAADTEAVLAYNGNFLTTTGIMTVTVTDNVGATASVLIPMQPAGAGASLTVTPPTSDFNVGVAAQENFQVTGGTPPYTWSVMFPGVYTPGDEMAFNFVSAGDLATLIYDGTAVPAGVIVVSAQDSIGATGFSLVTVSITAGGGGALFGAMAITPEEVDVGGEVVVQFTLTDNNGDPVSGVDVDFEFLNQTPDSDTVFVAPEPVMAPITEHTVTTDANGVAIAVIEAGDTEETANVIVQGSVSGIVINRVFQVSRNLGSVTIAAADGSITIIAPATPAELNYVMAVTVTVLDGNGQPLANRVVHIVIPTLFNNNIDDTDPYALQPTALDLDPTDDDGETEFTLEVTVAPEGGGTFSVDVGETFVAGSMVLRGTVDDPGIVGSKAVLFSVTGTAAP